MLAKATGYGAGFSIVTTFKSLEKNKFSDKILETVKIWEFLRHKKLFSETQRKLLRNIDSEFHLEKNNENEILFYPITAYLGKQYSINNKKPSKEFIINNPYSKRSCEITIKLISRDNKAKARNIKINITNFTDFNIPFILTRDTILRIKNNGNILLYSKNWKKLKELKTKPCFFLSGRNKILLSANIETNSDALLSFEFRIKGDPQKISLKNKKG